MGTQDYHGTDNTDTQKLSPTKLETTDNEIATHQSPMDVKTSKHVLSSVAESPGAFFLSYLGPSSEIQDDDQTYHRIERKPIPDDDLLSDLFDTSDEEEHPKPVENGLNHNINEDMTNENVAPANPSVPRKLKRQNTGQTKPEFGDLPDSYYQGRLPDPPDDLFNGVHLFDNNDLSKRVSGIPAVAETLPPQLESQEPPTGQLFPPTQITAGFSPVKEVRSFTMVVPKISPPHPTTPQKATSLGEFSVDTRGAVLLGSTKGGGTPKRLSKKKRAAMEKCGMAPPLDVSVPKKSKTLSDETKQKRAETRARNKASKEKEHINNPGLLAKPKRPRKKKVTNPNENVNDLLRRRTPKCHPANPKPSIIPDDNTNKQARPPPQAEQFSVSAEPLTETQSFDRTRIPLVFLNSLIAPRILRYVGCFHTTFGGGELQTQPRALSER